MLKVSGSARLWITAGLLLTAFALLHRVSHAESIVPAPYLHEFPYALGDWTGRDQPFSPQIERVLGITDYTNRAYSSRQGGLVQVYVGYYASQRTGETVHSPKNCLPGSGWDPIRSGYVTIPVLGGNRQITVNEYVIEQGRDKRLVFYWYQGRGRVLASEYAAKFWMVADAISRNRTDGALVRLITPTSDGEENARKRLETFTQLIFPHLDRLIPKD